MFPKSGGRRERIGEPVESETYRSFQVGQIDAAVAGIREVRDLFGPGRLGGILFGVPLGRYE